MKHYFALVCILLLASLAFAQTNPTPQTLPYSQNFPLATFPWSSTTYPAGIQGWWVSSTPGTEFSTSPAFSDRAMAANSTIASTSAQLHNYRDRIGFLNSDTRDLCFVLAVKTEGKQNIALAYDVMTIRNPYGFLGSNRINEVIMQYRVGTEGNFTNIPGTEYQNNTTQVVDGNPIAQNNVSMNLTLPAACNNQPIVQLRLISRQVSGTGTNYPSFAIDNIFVTGEDIPTLPVELSSFTATLAAQNLVRLDWTTQSETGALGFYVYRGTHSDPASAILASPLIQATNTSSPHSYSYADAELPGPGTFHYWLLCADQDGGAVWHGPVAMVVSSPEDLPPQEIPLQTGLRGIFPNPFNPLAYIDYYLEAPAPVVFSIYDNRGRLARVLDQGTCPAGHQRVEWDGRDSGGLPCGSGTYHIRMDAGSRSFTAKAALLK